MKTLLSIVYMTSVSITIFAAEIEGEPKQKAKAAYSKQQLEFRDKILPSVEHCSPGSPVLDTALLGAIGAEDPELVQLLLAKKANPDAPLSKNPLALAAIVSAHLLLGDIANPSLKISQCLAFPPITINHNEPAETRLQRASVYETIASSLLQAGAHPDMTKKSLDNGTGMNVPWTAKMIVNQFVEIENKKSADRLATASSSSQELAATEFESQHTDQISEDTCKEGFVANLQSTASATRRAKPKKNSSCCLIQ